MDQASIGGIVVAVVSALGILIGVNRRHIHSKLRSNCCGKVSDVTIDYDTSPVQKVESEKEKELVEKDLDKK